MAEATEFELDAPEEIETDVVPEMEDDQVDDQPPAEGETETPDDETDCPPDETEPAETETRIPTETQTILEKIQAQAMMVDVIEDEIADLKEDLKQANSKLKQEISALRRLCSRLREGQRNSETLYSPQPELEPPVEDSDNPATGDNGEAEWRSASLHVLELNTVKGFGKKKVEALIDLCPTVGDMEDLRCRIGKDAATFHELLPSGIGREAADEIENRLVEFIGKAFNLPPAETYDPPDDEPDEPDEPPPETPTESSDLDDI